MAKRYALYMAATALIAYAALEVFSYVAYYAVRTEPFTFTAAQAQRKAVMGEMGAVSSGGAGVGRYEQWHDRYMIHPYLGYVLDQSSPSKLRKGNGFLAEQDPLQASRDPKNMIVAITGGSVAEYFFQDDSARATLRHALEVLPANKEKRIVLIMLGMAAYHQPQQFLAVAYYLAQGGRLDILINIDGVNEAVSPYVSWGKGQYPAYPAIWERLAPDSADPQKLATLAAISRWKEDRLRFAKIADMFNFSISAQTLWVMADHYAAMQLASIEQDLSHQQFTKGSDVIKGDTALNKANMEEFKAFRTMLWQQGSLQLHYLAISNRFQYFHFLQPNQYVEGSKSFSAQEKKQAYEPGNYIGISVRAAYPGFQHEMSALVKEGVKIYDLTGIYKSIYETIYIDACCHTNVQGKHIMAEAIARQISQVEALHTKLPTVH